MHTISMHCIRQVRQQPTFDYALYAGSTCRLLRGPVAGRDGRDLFPLPPRGHTLPRPAAPPTTTMKLAVAALLAAPAAAFAPSAFGAAGTASSSATSTALAAEIRGPTKKAENLAFGWDGSTALGGAVVNSAPARMLEDIRSAGESIPEACELFNANLEMDGDSVTFEEVIELIDTHYEDGLIEFKNGAMTNAPGENAGSAKVLSYAALCDMSKEETLKLWGQYYRDVLATPDGDDHQNIRNFMKTGWQGVPFENGIALTKKNTGENEWDWDAESWIP